MPDGDRGQRTKRESWLPAERPRELEPYAAGLPVADRPGMAVGTIRLQGHASTAALDARIHRPAMVHAAATGGGFGVRRAGVWVQLRLVRRSSPSAIVRRGGLKSAAARRSERGRGDF